MNRVYLGLGSNAARDYHLQRGLDALNELGSNLQVSPVFESDAVGMLGKRFYNLVAVLDTRLSLTDLNAALKAIEAACGRREAKVPGRITLDIDILTYGELTGVHAGLQLPRAEILRNAFVLWPLALLAPEVILPGTERTCAQHWAAWQGAQQLWPVAFVWHDRVLTPDALLLAAQSRAAL
ncbi:2-amino-4-hydroxy-6-hydroxymethyldihydropteridine diphosphokinase [Halopseudomonas sabulinigri]|uniref:2-amino-4-hydroxy-6-hydroxymethyldihydropteridine diphosphokinase n=1 Tax=Halopseudomonas sabulinigri TaxID=472181 RepID=A0A1H1SCV5_9GAMM|nr:2-amino-4-hydroxy-6-hydroxymethyldihydropteridine diphosphokinase [Halopseudomonas sabulinigri]SDS45189.1 2-amino-4-hydroxy-6-hydroxymethyldihydropteridinediphosphokinase [Halopseudomonas sabulinigri]